MRARIVSIGVRRRAAVVVALIGTGITGLVSSAPALAQPMQAVVGMPFAGQWAYNANVNPPYTDSNSSHPAVHHRYYGDWATDLYASAGTPVTLSVTSPQGSVTFSVNRRNDTCSSAGANVAGRGITLNVIVNGSTIGSIDYEHLDGISAGPFTNGMTLGSVTSEPFAAGCYTARHTHIELKNATGYSCYVDKGNPGVRLPAGDAVGVLGSDNNGPQQACASIPGTPPPPTPSYRTPSAMVDPNNGDLVSLAIGGNNHLYQFTRDHTTFAWTTYDLTTVVGGTAVSGNPVAVKDPNGRGLDVLATGTDGHLYQFARDRTTFAWSVYDLTADVGGGVTVTGSPAAIGSSTGGVLEVLATGTNGHLYEFARNRRTFVWTAYDLTNNVGGTVVASSPSTTVDAQGALVVVATGSNHHLYQFARDRATFVWTAYDLTNNVGGTTVGGVPTAFKDPNNTGLDVVVTGTDGHLYQFARDSATFVWTAYDLTNNVGGSATIMGNPTAVRDPGGGGLDVLATGTNGHLYQFARQRRTFVWTVHDLSNNVGGTSVAGSPATTVDAQGVLVVLASGSDNHLLQFARDRGTFVWAVYDLTNSGGGTAV